VIQLVPSLGQQAGTSTFSSQGGADRRSVLAGNEGAGFVSKTTEYLVR
jgi:hypothetical protein